MNQERYCTSKLTAQTTIVFINSIYDVFKTHINSIYDVFKTQNWYFIKVALTRLFCTTACQQAHWTVLSLLQVMFCLKGNARLLSSQRRLLTNELTCAYQVNLTYFMHKARKQKTLSYFELVETSLEFSKQIADDCPFDQDFFTGKYRKHRILSCVASRFRDSC